MEPRVVDVQLSIFAVNTDPTNEGYARIAAGLQDSCAFLQDSNPTVLPTNDAPSDIPRLIIQTRDGKISVTITKQKLWLVARNSDLNNLAQLMTEVDNLRTNLIDYIYSKNWSVNRVGVVVNMEREMSDEDAPTYLRRRFIRENDENISEHPHELGITYVERRSLLGRDDQDTNFLVILSQKGSGNNRVPNYLSGVFDVNTRPEFISDRVVLNRGEVVNFITEAIREVQLLPAQYMGG